MGADAVKIGMVSQPETIRIIAAGLRKYAPQWVVVDPVMISKSGYHLLQPEAEVVLVEELLPLATVVTPNIPEAETILHRSIESLADMEVAARDIQALGPQNVLLKGGHLPGETVIDLLMTDTGEKFLLEAPRIHSANTHGTGCTLSSAIAAYLARNAELSFVAEANELILGAILVGSDGRRGYLQHLSVAAAWRGVGIGRALLQAAIQALQAMGVEKSHLFVHTDNQQAQAFYRHLGWQQRTDISVYSFNASANLNI